ncbi:hypothetical protein ACLOJK_014524 [Asimina triloba]
MAVALMSSLAAAMVAAFHGDGGAPYRCSTGVPHLDGVMLLPSAESPTGLSKNDGCCRLEMNGNGVIHRRRNARLICWNEKDAVAASGEMLLDHREEEAAKFWDVVAALIYRSRWVAAIIGSLPWPPASYVAFHGYRLLLEMSWLLWSWMEKTLPTGRAAGFGRRWRDQVQHPACFVFGGLDLPGMSSLLSSSPVAMVVGIEEDDGAPKLVLRGENLVVKRVWVGLVPRWVTEREVLFATLLGSIEARGNSGRRPIGLGQLGFRCAGTKP